METLDVLGARRLALAKAGLLNAEWTRLPSRAAGRGTRARAAAHRVIDRFGYLQLDTVSIAGARSHALVLLSRLDGFDPALAEELLAPGEPLFEYWGHEASWLPLDLYPVFAFRRREFKNHPWWGNVIGSNRAAVRDVRKRVLDEGPLRSVDLEGEGSRGWWDLKIAKKVAIALWCSGEFAIRERRSFQRAYDLAERVLPSETHAAPAVAKPRALEILLGRALDGHGWSTAGTLGRTWRLTNLGPEIRAALSRMEKRREIVPCALVEEGGKRTAGWARPEDLELADRLRRARPREDRAVLLSPFDPVLWERPRVQTLFGFDQVLEIFKPAPQRKYGYFCLPVLAGERLIARFDLKADRRAGTLRVISARLENPSPADRSAAAIALNRYANAVGLQPQGWKA